MNTPLPGNKPTANTIRRESPLTILKVEIWIITKDKKMNNAALMKSQRMFVYTNLMTRMSTISLPCSRLRAG